MPLLILFIMGCYSLVLVLKVDEELEARRIEAEQRRAEGLDDLDPLAPNDQAADPAQIVDAPAPLEAPNNIREEHN